MWVLSRKAGIPRCVEYRELLSDESFVRGLKVEDGPRPAEDYLREGLELAVTRGTALQVSLRRGESREVWFFLNTHSSRDAVRRLSDGETVTLSEAMDLRPIDEVSIYRPNAFALYEQNIGPLTPMIADVLRDAERRFPAEWIEEAMQNAVEYNRRSWRYVEAILQRWESEGRQAEMTSAAGEPGDPDSYFRTRYSHVYK